MSRRSILGLIGLCLVSGISANAQNPFSCYANASVAPTLRFEGLTEVVGDIIVDCIGGIPTPAGNPIPQVNFTISLNVNATSRILNTRNSLSDAILVVDEPTTGQGAPGNYLLCGSASGCSITGTGVLNSSGTMIAGPDPYAGTMGRPNVFQGIVSGNQLQFLGVPVDAPGPTGHRVFRFTNIRVNVSGVSGPSGTPVVVQAAISAAGSTSVPLVNPNQIVGFVQPGMIFQYVSRTSFDAANYSSDISFSQNTPLPRTGANNNFIVRFTETYPGAFRKVGTSGQSIPGMIYNTESGLTHAGTLGSIGLADSGTRLKAVFTNIPAGVNVYASLTNYAAFGRPIWNGAVLRSGEFGPVISVPATNTDLAVPAAISNPVASGGYGSSPAPVPGAAAQLPVVNGTAAAVWEVTAADSLMADHYDFVVWFSYHTSPAPATGTVQVKGSFAPTPTGMAVSAAASTIASSTLPIPRYSDYGTARPAFIIATNAPVSMTTPSPLPSGAVGLQYSTTLGASGGTAVYSWTVVSGSFPIGLVLSPTGTISGVPTAATTAAFRVRVTDTNSVYDEKDYVLAIGVTPISITTAASLPAGLVGVPYLASLTAVGGAGGYTWTLVGGSLPAGLSLNGDGSINGAPTTTVISANFRVRVRDVAAAYVEKDFTLTVNSNPVQITTASEITSGTVGVALTIPLTAYGGAGSYTWSKVSGDLPAGLVLNANGSITGTPTDVFSAGFRLRASDTAGNHAEKEFHLTIVSGGPPPVSGSIIWYNGDFNGRGVLEMRALGATDIGLLNQANAGYLANAAVYDNFSVTEPLKVTAVFSNNFATGGFWPAGATWEIRSGLRAGNGGTLVASGSTSTNLSWRPTLRSALGDLVEYSLVVSGLNVILPTGTYWLSVVPIGYGLGNSYIGITSGHSGVGSPKGNDNRSFFNSLGGPAYVSTDSLLYTASGNYDFSMGLASTDPPRVFTSRIAAFASGRWQMDVNGNGTYDSNADRDFFLGWPGATMVIGDWNGDGRTKAGVYDNGYWFLDYDGNGVWDGGIADKLVAWGWTGATPMVGDWSGDGKTKIGVYSNGFWFLDYNGDYLWDGGVIDKQVGWGWAGVTPVVGDWNGNGRTKLGVYSNGFWFLDYNGDYLWDGGVTDKQVGWGWTGVTPIVGDWNGNRRTKIGVYAGGYWYLDYDGNYLWQYPAYDKVWSVGWAGTSPVMGDWNGDGKTKAGAFINGYWYLDYDGSGLFESNGTDRIYALGGAGDTPAVGRW